LRFSGTIFHYARDPQGFAAPDTIMALGPTNEPIYVVVGIHRYRFSFVSEMFKMKFRANFFFVVAISRSQRGSALRVQHT